MIFGPTGTAAFPGGLFQLAGAKDYPAMLYLMNWVLTQPDVSAELSQPTVSATKTQPEVTGELVTDD